MFCFLALPFTTLTYLPKLFESNAKPHLYWFAAKFWKKKHDSRPSYYRPTTCSGLKEEHLKLFTSFFQRKTGVSWSERVVRAGTTESELFQYTPPVSSRLWFFIFLFHARLDTSIFTRRVL